MVKFLQGSQYSGAQIPVCTFWSTQSVTNIDEDFSEIESQVNSGRCIANHYFSREDISCFNDGQCNREGKCLPCTKYKYSGMRMAISHSPPLEFFREFNKGLTERDIFNPQLRATGDPVTAVSQDQLPFHVLLRNLQAEVAKCCRWSGGDGRPSQFVITPIINGPDTITLTDADGSTSQLQGIRVQSSVFPDVGGSFFPVGTNVVAGWADEPSFYLEPRTGLVKNGEGIVFRASSAANSSLAKTKSIATSAPAAANNALSAIELAQNQAAQLLSAETNFANNLLQSNAPAAVKENAQAQVVAKQAAFDAIDTALTDATALSSTISSQASSVASATEVESIVAAGTALADSLEQMSTLVDTANINAGGEPASGTAGAAARILTSLVQQLRFSGSGGFTKCELAFLENNPAAQWNLPEDGSLPCNGVRTDCPFYTGPTWQHATTEKLEIGKPVLAEAVQEIRFYSDDWSRFSNPEEEFRTRFSVPFLWAFKDYISAGGTPDVEDMLLYRPKTIFARAKSNFNAPDDNPNTLLSAFDTMLIEKVSISDFDNFAVGKSISRIQPGQEVLDKDKVPSFATTIDKFSVPVATRLKITHPSTEAPFVYRTWSPRFTNRISMFGNASPSQTVYIVNNTALRERDRYHQFFGTRNVFNIPPALPGAGSNFNFVRAFELKAIFDNLDQEKKTNDSEAVLGFDLTSSDQTGFWDSIIQVDLVHNAINDIFVFILINDFDFVFDKVQVDHRVLHSFVTQDNFTATDFTIHDVGGGSSQLGIAVSEIDQDSSLSATARQALGSEPVSIHHGYYAWRFKNRGLALGLQNDKNDIIGDEFVVESDANAFISNVAYRVVQYRDTEQIANWYLLQDCGIIMAEIASPEVHRVLPLPDQSGEVQPLSPVLVNNGATGSITAQWAPESITLTIGGEEKDMVLIYRSEEGIGLPANYIICGPAPGASNLFGRPNPETDTLKVQYTYLRAQTHKKRDAESQTEPEGSGDIVSDNFYGDSLREHTQSITFTETGLVAGGTRPNHIALDQQDYCFVFSDSTGRPIGRKVVRFAVCYYNLACVSVEIFYSWRSNCVTYGLVPDLFANLGNRDGTTTSAPKGTTNPEDLQLGFRVASLLGARPCGQTPNCGDHEVLRLGPLRKEFEVIANIGGDDDGAVVQKAFFPSAGGVVQGIIVSAEPPGTQWQLKRGALWYPYTDCERPRYRKSTNGPLFTDTTELINSQTGQPGIATSQFGAGTVEPGVGTFGGLPARSEEAYRGHDEVVARILDHHPGFRPCQLDYTYGNTVRTGGDEFTGYARRRGEIDLFWYDGLSWSAPPFGNFGRNMLMAEIAVKVGDYSPGGNQAAFRWMPVGPEREDLGATVGLFGEGPNPESVLYRLLGGSTPLGAVGETAPDGDERYTQTSLVGIRTGGTYPHVPFFFVFLPDALLGLEPNEQGISAGSTLPRGPTTTAWAWREAARPIERGTGGTEIMRGLHLALPEYFLNNIRMETRLRPAEGNYLLNYTAPQYDEDGTIIQNATLTLGDGPSREIVIDFANREFRLADQPDTLYDSSKILGDAPFDCEPRLSNNLNLALNCGCEGEVEWNPSDPNAVYPAIFIHADALAPDGYFALYSTEEIGPAFPTDLPLGPGSPPGPPVICNYFIEHIYFRLDSNFVPVTPSFDPAFSSEPTMQYTWSRVPHGRLGGAGRDGSFGGQENAAQNYREKQGVLTTRPFNNQTQLSDRSSAIAYFPSSAEAQQASQDSTGIVVPGFLVPGDPKLLGGVPVQAGVSQGQSEQITLDVLIGTFVTVRSVRIWFLAGSQMQVPTVILTGIPTDLRTGNLVTARTGRILGRTSATANGADIPSSQNFSQQAISDGRALFQVVISPAYSDTSFWDQFYQEFHLIFGERTADLSMGIYAIEFEVDALLPESSIEESIFIPERKYYRSTFTPNNKNPMELLFAMDNATGYWRSTSIPADQGANRSRAYVWETKSNNETGLGQGGGSPTIEGPIQDLEKLQAEEYNKARSLMPRPYTFSLPSFIPLDEQNWLEFLGGNQPAWTTTLSVNVSDIDKVSSASSGDLLYGEIPERSPWHAPGHAWIHLLGAESYLACCDDCVDSQVVSYEFAHLHDGLQTFEPAGFWDEMPSGLLKAVRSIIDSPDVVILNQNELFDAQGNPISQNVIEESGIVRDAETGELLIQ